MSSSGAREAELTEIVDVAVAYVEPVEGGWMLRFEGEEQRFATASGAIFHGIQEARALARTGRETWVLWRNGEAWSVAWTSDSQAPSP
jgi:hypothetical protein